MTQSRPGSPPSRPKGVRAVRVRLADGQTAVYWYCRLTNTRLPAPDEPGFAAALAAARASREPKYADGSLGHIIAAWKRSQEYARLAERTKDTRGRYLRPLSADAWSARQAAGITRAELLEMRDAIATAHGPSAANAFMDAASVVFGWALERGLLAVNPLARAKRLEGGHFLAWTDEEAQVAMTNFREHVRRAIVLAYHTGQRRGDLANLLWAAYDGRRITLMPEKTRRRREAKGQGPLRVPVHPELRRELAIWKTENEQREKPSKHILTCSLGTPWGREALSMAVKAAVDKAKLRPGLNLHGFRKLAAVRLAEAGATTSEIAAAIGWDSLSHVELYTRSANQERLADAAVIRLSNALAKTGKY
jgi:integrase